MCCARNRFIPVDCARRMTSTKLRPFCITRSCLAGVIFGEKIPAIAGWCDKQKCVYFVAAISPPHARYYSRTLFYARSLYINLSFHPKPRLLFAYLRSPYLRCVAFCNARHSRRDFSSCVRRIKRITDIGVSLRHANILQKLPYRRVAYPHGATIMAKLV